MNGKDALNRAARDGAIDVGEFSATAIEVLDANLSRHLVPSDLKNQKGRGAAKVLLMAARHLMGKTAMDIAFCFEGWGRIVRNHNLAMP